MKKIIILSGHGHYATGLQSSIELLAGKNEDMFFVDFTIEDTDVTLKEKMLKVIDENKESEVLFVCDILGGTPFKTAAEIANSNDKMEVVAGCNVGSVIESIFQKDTMTIGELAESIVDASKQSTMKFNKVVISEVLDYLDTEDGI